MQLLPNPISQDLLDACHDLVEGVKSGDITGLGVVVVLRGRRFFVDALGSLAKNPHPARGYVAALDDCLREIAHRKGNNTTM